ncbi:MAG: Imidazoleglycerol-phosphate dehydratase [uncultured Solirubrobacterales bacterium]|uniref:Imidazoleglycerol-phosphate dehydratase n=1 Tax=uncultured Solirubrobacterales bacterium TaxID=768556 RepID=A0A6J4RP52_9ACTN|nr:MAG: Imidazoleglycerol-phosphate dehydratase [uncultured Solirubrobacterales bacterium]
MSRTATLSRTTSETDISLSLGLDGSGAGERRTGVGYFDHMLDALARHGGLDLEVEARGDLETGAHHTVEDVGLLLGSALDEALEDRSGIARFGDATVPMDEARAAAAIDLSGRPLCVFEATRLPALVVGGFETELGEEFMRAVVSTARMTLHVRVEAGRSAHHMIEAAFKAFARALRAAVAIDPDAAGRVPSTKGVL